MSLYRAALIAYTGKPPRGVVFDFNPKSLKRTRSLKGKTTSADAVEAKSGETVAQATTGLTVESETISLEFMLDATDRLGNGDPISEDVGVEPEIDTLRALVDGHYGGTELADFVSRKLPGVDGSKYFSEEPVPIVMFVWGRRILPVTIKQLAITETAHLPNLAPYRADVSVTLEVLGDASPLMTFERARRTGNVLLNTTRTGLGLLGDVLTHPVSVARWRP